MDLTEIISNAVSVKRANEMKTSEQLTLGELILKFEAVKDKSLPVIFDDTYHPIGIGSWRGSYCELAIEYGKDEPRMTAKRFLQKLHDLIGAILTGYKGGEFVMGKITPIWVANYGNSCGFTGVYQAVIDLEESTKGIIIKTKYIEY